MQPSINGKIVAGASDSSELVTSMPTGVAGFGTGWNVGLFSNLSLYNHPKHPAMPNSFIFDLIASETVISNFTGLAGMILDLSQGRYGGPTMLASRLGRFKSAGNKMMHTIGVYDATSCRWVGSNVTVDMRCYPDALGFCYSSKLATAVKLQSGSKYYIVSSETNGEAFVAMTKSATGADYGSYRDGDTLMTYELPPFYGRTKHQSHAGMSLVSGKVKYVEDRGWEEEVQGGDLDTSYGPINFVLTK